MAKKIKTKEFDEKFDRGEDVSEYLDTSSATKKVNVDFGVDFLNQLDAMAKKMSVTRQSLIKVWLHERLVSELEKEQKSFDQDRLIKRVEELGELLRKGKIA